MAYSELIKDYERVRDYMRQFYVYGFKSREEYDAKSPRSYDNECRRIESWLGKYMSFRQDAGGKQVFLSVGTVGPFLTILSINLSRPKSLPTRILPFFTIY